MTMFPAEDDAGDERLPDADPSPPGEATATLPDAEPSPSAAAVARPRNPGPSSFGDAVAALPDDGPQRHGAALRYSVELLAYYYAVQGRPNPAQQAIRTLVTDRFDILDTPQFGLYAPKGQGAAVADAGLRIMDALNADSVADPVWVSGAADSTEAQRRADYAQQARGGRWVMDITGRHAILRDAQGRSVLAGSNISRVRLKGVPVVGFVMDQADQVQPVGDTSLGGAGRLAVEDRPINVDAVVRRVAPENSADLAGDEAGDDVNVSPTDADQGAREPTTQHQQLAKPQAWDVILPRSKTAIEDPSSETGYLMGPKSDLREVAAAGREASYKLLTGSFKDFIDDFRRHVGQGGTFDYQRKSDGKGGWINFKEFVNVSSFNVGLFCHEAGLSLDHTLWIAGLYAHWFSNNAAPWDPNRSPIWESSQFLPEHAIKYITEGWNAGKRREFFGNR